MSVIVWFRNDLRLLDNPIFHCAAFRKATSVIPVYCFDPRHFQTTKWGSKKTGVFRSRFLVESVIDLKQSLQQLQSDLTVYFGTPELIIPQIANQLTQKTGKGVSVVFQAEATFEEKEVEQALQKNLWHLASPVSTESAWGHTMLHPDDLPFAIKDLPEPFTKMRNMVERKTQVRPVLPVPSPFPSHPKLAFETISGHITINPNDEKQTASVFHALLGFSREEWDFRDSRASLDFRGGERAGIARLEHFCNSGLATYKQTRNELLGADTSSKFSPWLAHGCVSARQIYHRIAAFEKANGGETVDTYWVFFELLWRDFFRFYALKYGNKIFFRRGPTNGSAAHIQAWDSTNYHVIDAWKQGTTGVDLVDANMVELNRTGFMSNRGRQIVASYLVLDLGVDWRVGADYFESLLLDHDVCSNYGNWLFAAGVGTQGQRINRFNVAKQAAEYDAVGAYRKLWLRGKQQQTQQQQPHQTSLTNNNGNTAINMEPSSVEQQQQQQQQQSGTSGRKVYVPRDSKDGVNKKHREVTRIHRGKQHDFFTS